MNEHIWKSDADNERFAHMLREAQNGKSPLYIWNISLKKRQRVLAIRTGREYGGVYVGGNGMITFLKWGDITLMPVESVNKP